MSEEKGLEHEHNKKCVSPTPWKITKWEGLHVFKELNHII